MNVFVKKALVEEFDTRPKSDKKTKIRKEIQESIFDDRDAIADNAKMIGFYYYINKQNIWYSTSRTKGVVNSRW